MTQGFDDFYGSLELQYLNTQEVGELCFEAGAASRQAEIDELKNDLIKAAEGQMKLFEHNNELQKRIDDALAQLELLHFMKTTNSNNAIKILKGESNE